MFTSASNKGSGGEELWINTGTFARSANGTGCFFGLKHFAILHSAPQCLFLKVRTEGLRMLLVCAHCLHQKVESTAMFRSGKQLARCAPHMSAPISCRHG